MTSTHEPPEEDRQRPRPERPRDWRDEVEPAEPAPLTDAMLNPKPPSPGPKEFVGEPQGARCHVCGVRNHVGASYCLNCGVQLPPATPEPEPPAAPFIAPRPDDGFIDPDLEVPVAGRARDRAMEETAPEPTAAERRDAQRTLQVALAALMVVAVLALLMVTFGGEEEPAGPASTTAAMDVDAVTRYAELVSSLTADLEALATDAALANQRWEQDAADFQTTLAEFTAVADAAQPIAATVAAAEVPAAADQSLHLRLVSSSEVIADAAEELVAGLEAPDEGQARTAALNRFQAAVGEFKAIAASIAQSLTALSDSG